MRTRAKKSWAIFETLLVELAERDARAKVDTFRERWKKTREGVSVRVYARTVKAGGAAVSVLIAVARMPAERAQ